MFRKNFLSMMIFICTFFLTLVPLYAQDEGEIIIISERVGKEIDKMESERFKLFEDIKGFQSAVYLQLPDSSFLLKITYLDDQTGEIKINRIQLSEVNINNRRIYIDHFEEIPAQKVCEDSSKQKTFCLSIGGGVPIYERGSKLLADLNHLPITFQLLKFPIAVMVSLDYSSGVNSSIYNILYIKPLTKDKNINVFLGGGIGSFEIFELTKPYYMDYNKQKYTLYNFEVGCKAKLWVLGSFAKVKYFYAKGTENCLLFIWGFDINICL